MSNNNLKASVESGGIILLILVIISLGVLGYELFNVMSLVVKIIFGLFIVGCVISLTYRILKWWFLKKENSREEEIEND